MPITLSQNIKQPLKEQAFKNELQKIIHAITPTSEKTPKYENVFNQRPLHAIESEVRRLLKIKNPHKHLKSRLNTLQLEVTKIENKIYYQKDATYWLCIDYSLYNSKTPRLYIHFENKKHNQKLKEKYDYVLDTPIDHEYVSLTKYSGISIYLETVIELSQNQVLLNEFIHNMPLNISNKYAQKYPSMNQLLLSKNNSQIMIQFIYLLKTIYNHC